MSTPESTIPNPDVDDIYSLQAKITNQQSLVRQLKKDGSSAEIIAKNVEILTQFREKFNQLEKELSGDNTVASQFNRKVFDELLLRKMYVVKSFEIHNGPAGLYDYGPPACALKSNVLATWRNMFVLEEGNNKK